MLGEGELPILNILTEKKDRIIYHRIFKAYKSIVENRANPHRAFFLQPYIHSLPKTTFSYKVIPFTTKNIPKTP